MYWAKDSRKKAGGFWRCAVRERERQRRLYANDDFREAKLQRQRDRYDSDPVYRIGKNCTTRRAGGASAFRRRGSGSRTTTDTQADSALRRRRTSSRSWWSRQ
jgi:hypothetical protein